MVFLLYNTPVVRVLIQVLEWVRNAFLCLEGLTAGLEAFLGISFSVCG